MTPRQQKVLDTLILFREQHGISPTVRELMGLLGIKSPNGMMSHLLRLRVLGEVDWIDGASRSLIPLNEAKSVTVPLSKETHARLSAMAKKRKTTLRTICEELLAK
jgi:SOS-response transcriptional repressor LexA